MWGLFNKSKKQEEKSYPEIYEERFNFWLEKTLPEIKFKAKDWTDPDNKLYIFVHYYSHEDDMDIIHMTVPKPPPISGVYVGYYLNGEFIQSERRGLPGLIPESIEYENKIRSAKEKVLEEYPEVLKLYKAGLINFNF